MTGRLLMRNKTGIVILTVLILFSAAGLSAETYVPDTSFNGTGLFLHNNAAGGNSDDAGYSLAVDASGRIVVAGESTGAGTFKDMTVWRLLPSGIPDTAFSNKGWTIHRSAAGGNQDDDAHGVAVDTNGRIIAAGKSFNGVNYDMAVWRLLPDGGLDTAFSNKGYIVHAGAAGGNGDDWGSKMILDASNRILVAGGSRGLTSHDMALWRIRPDGSFDITFSNKGWTFHHNAAGGNAGDSGEGISLDGSGRILVTGPSMNGANYDMVVWRYNTDGSLDTAFSNKGWVVHQSAAGGMGSDYGSAVTTDGNGRILSAGRSFNGSNFDMVVWRYNTDGSLDTAFSNKGWIVHNNAAGGNGNDFASDIFIDANGKIWAAGGSTGPSSGYQMTVWRFNPDGSPDTTLNDTGYIVFDSAASGYGPSWAEAVTKDSQGNLLITGTCSNINGYDMAVWRYKTSSAGPAAVLSETVFDNLDRLVVAPNPYKPNSRNREDRITLFNLTPGFELKVFTETGKEVRSLTGTSSSGKYQWDGKNSQGSELKSGTYFLRVRDPGGREKRLKFVIIR